MSSFVKRELQGPRPSPLKVYKESHRVKKPQSTRHNNPPPQPIVIYLKSPEIIHVRPQDFMNLVQQLTGKPTTTLASSSSSSSSPSSYPPSCGSIGSLSSSSVKTQSDREVKEGNIGGVARGVSPNSMSSSLHSPMFPSNLFTPPSAHTNLLDFGTIF